MARIGRAKRNRSGRFAAPVVSPFASLPEQTIARRFIGFFDLIRSGISPGPEDSTAWYDRAIRTVGGTIVLIFFAAAIIMAAWNASR